MVKRVIALFSVLVLSSAVVYAQTFDPHRNFLQAEVVVAPSPATTGLSFSITVGQGVFWPDPATHPYNIVVFPAASPTHDNIEIVRAATLVGDTFTFTRHEESTTARTIVAGDIVMMAPTERTFEDIENAVWDATHGGTGRSTLTAHNVLVGNGTGTVTLVPGATNCVLAWTASSSDPTCSVNPAVTSLTASSAVIGGGLLANLPTGVSGYFVSASSSDPRGLMSAQFSTDTIAARVHLRKARGTESAPTTIVAGDLLGRVRFSGYDGSNYLQMASIDVGSTGTVASTRVPTYMAFSTGTDAAPSVLTERMRIGVSGGVNVGTDGTDVSANGLRVQGTLNAVTAIQLGGVSLNTAGALSNVAYLNQVNAFTFSDSATTTATSLMPMEHDSSGTPAAGFGLSKLVNLQSSTTTGRAASEQITTWATATDASRKARIVQGVYDTATREVWRGEASGSAPMIGFLGASAVVRQTGDAGTALVTLGLMSGTPTFGAANLTGTIASGVQDAIARTGTLVSGSTGSGFTIDVASRTVTGSLADAGLSSNVPLKNAVNTFTAFGGHTFSATGTGNNHIDLVNGSAGTGNQAYFEIATDGGGSKAQLDISVTSSTYTAGTYDAQKGAYVIAGGNTTGGLSVGTSATSATLRFYTGSGGIERMRIDSAGLVGIGTNAPNALLTVAGAFGTWGHVVIGIPGTTGSTSLVFGSGSDTASRSWRFMASESAQGDLSLQQSTTQTGSTFATKVNFNASGSVGIGMTPTKTLDVTGTSRVTGTGDGTFEATYNAATSVLAYFSQTGTSDVQVRLRRTAGTTSNLDLYLPAGSTRVDLINGSTTVVSLHNSGGVSIGDTTDPGTAGKLRLTATNPIIAPNVTTATGTAAVYDGSGNLVKTSSSARYKEHFSDFTVTPEALTRFVAMVPQNWDYRGQASGAVSFLSEQLDALPIRNSYGQSPLVNYDLVGRPDSNRDYGIIALQHLVLQNHDDRIAQLERVIAALQARLDALGR